MSLFVLDTDSASITSSSLSSLASYIDGIAGDISKYDTLCEDFDFATPKSVIANNIHACAIKVKNTASVIDTVVSSHMTLQNQLKYRDNTTTNAAKTQNRTYRSSSNSSASRPSTTTVSQKNNLIAKLGNRIVSSMSELVAGTVVSSKIQKVSYFQKGTSSFINHMLQNDDFRYSDLGFAKVGEMFIVSCGKSFGKIGEHLEITLNDGNVIHCIVGEQLEDDDGFQFMVSEDFDADKNGVSENYEDKITEIKNYGDTNYYAYGTEIKSAIDWALETASDDSHGYSQQSRWGQPSYDCSSFVISAFESAGIPVTEAGAGYTGNMKEAFLKCGFEWIPGDPQVEDLLPGDILLNEGNHTELYIGHGLMVGARGNYDSTGADSSGQEIFVDSYQSFPWNGILRYVGVSSSEKNEGDDQDA